MQSDFHTEKMHCSSYRNNQKVQYAMRVKVVRLYIQYGKELLQNIHMSMIKYAFSVRKSPIMHLENEFGNTLTLFNVGRSIYLRPHTLSPDSMALEMIDLQAKLKAYKNEGQCSELIAKAALVQRASVKSACINELSWPPNPRELDNHYAELPDYLSQFLRVLLGVE
ncbi:hypothetical protein SK128_012606 [Halocaridina rubra]|uniref:Uncharacterized protein n=1 Tax=Halocaridina rubra TaxID=373956 RepID=A0AAN8XPU0_HALRR